MSKKSAHPGSAPARNPPVICHTCREEIAVADGVRYGSMETGYRDLCSRCFNTEVACADGLKFQHVQFEPLDMRDAAGVMHRFHFRVHLLGHCVALDTFEFDAQGRPAGYLFQALGEPQGDLFELMGQLVERMRRSLAQRHLEFDEQFGQLHIAESTVRARIDSDADEDGQVPLLVIDGQQISWQQFGRMLMTFEGFQFKLEIRDKSEEI